MPQGLGLDPSKDKVVLLRTQGYAPVETRRYHPAPPDRFGWILILAMLALGLIGLLWIWLVF